MIGNSQIPVLQVIRQGIIGGGESHVISLVENLDRKKFKPVVLSFTDGPMVNSLKAMGVTVHVIPTKTPFDVSVWGKVYELIIKENIRLVHAHGTRAASNSFWACKKSKIPMLYTIHGWSFHDGQSYLTKKLRIASEKFITHQTTLNISVSQSNQDSGVEYLKKFSSVVIRYGIDQKKFNPKKTFNNYRETLGIKSDTILIGFIARMTFQKNPVKMIEAFASVAAGKNNIHLLMVGDGELKKDAIAKAKELGITKLVTFTNFSQNVPEVLNAIDIYCLPSYWEGLPIGLLEAMAMGKAIVASAVDGTTEVIKDHNNGILINPYKVDEISKALLELSTDDSLRKQVQQNAMLTVRENYIDDKMTREIESFYEKCLLQ